MDDDVVGYHDPISQPSTAKRPRTEENSLAGTFYENLLNVLPESSKLADSKLSANRKYLHGPGAVDFTPISIAKPFSKVQASFRGACPLVNVEVGQLNKLASLNEPFKITWVVSGSINTAMQLIGAVAILSQILSLLHNDVLGSRLIEYSTYITRQVANGVAPSVTTLLKHFEMSASFFLSELIQVRNANTLVPTGTAERSSFFNAILPHFGRPKLQLQSIDAQQELIAVWNRSDETHRIQVGSTGVTVANRGGRNGGSGNGGGRGAAPRNDRRNGITLPTNPYGTSFNAKLIPLSSEKTGNGRGKSFKKLCILMSLSPDQTCPNQSSNKECKYGHDRCMTDSELEKVMRK